MSQSEIMNFQQKYEMLNHHFQKQLQVVRSLQEELLENADCDYNYSQALMELESLVDELINCQNQLQARQTEISQELFYYEQENERLKEQQESLQMEVESKRLEVEHTQDILKKVENDVEIFKRKESDLIHEISYLRGLQENYKLKENHLKTLKLQYNEIKIINEQLYGKLKEDEETLHELEKDCSKLNQQFDLQKEYINYLNKKNQKMEEIIIKLDEYQKKLKQMNQETNQIIKEPKFDVINHLASISVAQQKLDKDTENPLDSEAQLDQQKKFNAQQNIDLNDSMTSSQISSTESHCSESQSENQYSEADKPIKNNNYAKWIVAGAAVGVLLVTIWFKKPLFKKFS